ncbi:MAG: pantoate--beta-alanine ligase [Gemmatimonas sp.]
MARRARARVARRAAKPARKRPPVKVVRTVAALRKAIAAFRKKGETVALVPTMGALHAGHLSLIAAAKKRADRVVATIFVNPTQFGPREDLSRYPRPFAADRKALTEAGADLLFAPTVEAMYPPGSATTLSVAGVSEGLCGQFRPGHFAGVATVVAKLLIQAVPDVAIFGEKDYQQLAVIRRMARDLDLSVRIEGAPTVREADGLAMSSRNAYLTPEQRRTAVALYRALARAAADVADGKLPWPDIADAAIRAIRMGGFDRVDYVELRDAQTLAPVDTAEHPARILAAAWMGDTRLIDNVPVKKR